LKNGPTRSSFHLQLASSRSFSSALRAPLTQYSDEELVLKQSVSRFANEVVKPRVREMDEKGHLRPDILSQLFEQGFMGVEVPSEYGGSEMSFTQSCIVIEELARIDPAIAVIVDIQNTLLNTILMRWGSAEQKKKYLHLLATNTLGSFCLSEPAAGSDAFALQTTATKKGNKWVLNGNKLWISNAAEAGVFLIFANADKSKGYKGITAFLVERGAKGLSIGKKEDKLGIRASSTCPLTFEDLEVAEENVVGEVGSGYKVAIEALNEGRIGIGAQMVGLAQGAFDAAMPYIHERKAFGQPIATFQGMQFSFAQAATLIEASRLMVLNACRLKESGLPFAKEAAMAKLYSSQIAEQVASKSVEWLGGVGFTKEFAVEKFYRDAKIGSIYEGTTNLQLQTIAKMISKNYLK